MTDFQLEINTIIHYSSNSDIIFSKQITDISRELIYNKYYDTLNNLCNQIKDNIKNIEIIKLYSDLISNNIVLYGDLYLINNLLFNFSIKEYIEISKLINTSIFRGDIEIIKYFFELYPEYDIKDNKDWIIDQIFEKGNLEVYKYIIKIRYELFELKDFKSDFFHCCVKGYFDILKYIKEICPNVMDKFYYDNDIENDKEYFTTAIYYGHYEIVKQLYEWDHNLCEKSIDNNLFEYACSGKSLDIIKFLYELKKDTNFITEECLENVFRKGSIDILEFIYKIKPNLKIENKYLLKNAFINEYFELIFFMNRKDPELFKKLTIKDYQDISIYLCISNNLEILQYLYNLVPDFDLSFNNEKLFIDTCYYGHLEIMDQLYKWNPKINLSIDNEMPLRMACKGGKINILRRLYELNPKMNISILDDEPFFNACSGGHIEIIKQLYEWNPKIDLRKKDDKYFKICTIFPNYRFKILKQLCEWCPEFKITSINREKIFSLIRFSNEYKKELYDLDREVFDEELFKLSIQYSDLDLILFYKKFLKM